MVRLVCVLKVDDFSIPEAKVGRIHFARGEPNVKASIPVTVRTRDSDQVWQRQPPAEYTLLCLFQSFIVTRNECASDLRRSSRRVVSEVASCFPVSTLFQHPVFTTPSDACSQSWCPGKRNKGWRKYYCGNVPFQTLSSSMPDVGVITWYMKFPVWGSTLVLPNFTTICLTFWSEETARCLQSVKVMYWWFTSYYSLCTIYFRFILSLCKSLIGYWNCEFV